MIDYVCREYSKADSLLQWLKRLGDEVRTAVAMGCLRLGVCGRLAERAGMRGKQGLGKRA